jgi:hypothetical protein
LPLSLRHCFFFSLRHCHFAIILLAIFAGCH